LFPFCFEIVPLEHCGKISQIQLRSKTGRNAEDRVKRGMDASELNERPTLYRAESHVIPPDWLAEFEAAARRPLETRFRYSFIHTYNSGRVGKD
jgi:hypothetical protein